MATIFQPLSIMKLGQSIIHDRRINMSQKKKAEVMSLWKKGKNVWEISQLTGLSEPEVMDIVQGRA